MSMFSTTRGIGDGLDLVYVSSLFYVRRLPGLDVRFHAYLV